MSQEIHGWLFPDDVDVPEQSWYRMDFSGREVWDMDKHGHIEVARQVGLDSIQTKVTSSGTDDEGVRYAAVEATVGIDGEPYEAVGGADSTSQQVRNPEHVWSVAETRALKRAIKRAVGIREAGDGPDADEGAGQPQEDPKPSRGAPQTGDPPEPTESAGVDDDVDW